MPRGADSSPPPQKIWRHRGFNLRASASLRFNSSAHLALSLLLLRVGEGIGRNNESNGSGTPGRKVD